MKRILSFVLCLAMFLFIAPMAISAEETGYTNIAPLGSTYSSSNWNLDSQPKYVIDTVRDSSYQFWRPSDPNRNPAISSDDAQYIGIKYSKYYEINSITVYAYKYASTNNIHYTVKALIMGEWQEVAYFDNNSSTLEDTDGKGQGTGFYVYKANFSKAVTTKRIQIEVDNYGTKDGGNGNWWDIPIIQEVELQGKLGVAPEFDVPDGAVLSTNASLGGMAEASSSASGKNPGLVNDNDKTKYWKAKSKNNDEYVLVNFDEEVYLDDITLNFGGVSSTDAGHTYDYDVQILQNGTWKSIQNYTSNQTFTATSSETAQDDIVYNLNVKMKASAIKVIFTDTFGKQATLTEIGSTISDNGKCIFLSGYITTNKKQSTALGNLACYGSAYASSTFEYNSIAETNYINDGNIDDTHPVWIAETRAKDCYCGITFEQKYDIDKVTLYFNQPEITNRQFSDVVTANHTLSYDVQAKVDGEYVTVASGTSYDAKTKKYIVTLTFDAVNTDDIRIVFKTNGGTFAYLKELEIYQTGYVIPAYEGYSTSRKAVAETTDFGAPYKVARALYLDNYYPLSELVSLTDTLRMADFI